MATEADSRRRFVGRAETVEALHRKLEEVRAGKSGVTLLMGDTGVGKSALMGELVSDLRAQRINVLTGRALAVDDPPPYSLIQSVLTSSRTGPAPWPKDSPGAGRDLLPREAGTPESRGTTSRPPDFEAQLLDALGVTGKRERIPRDLVLPRIADRFLEVTRPGPGVLILDNLDRADESSLTAIEFLVNHLQNQALWVLGCSRSFASLSEPKRKRLEAFQAATQAQLVGLGPLLPEEVGRFLGEINPSHKYSPEEAEWLYTESGGNPLLLQRLEHQMSSGQGARARSGTTLPPLDKEAQRTLEVAAVLGPEFSFDLLLGASGAEEGRLMETVDDLVDRGLLFERPGELLEFPQDRLRAEAYNRLTENERQEIHRRAGKTREALESAGSTRIFGLARDFYLGKEDLKSLEYNRFAAEMAKDAQAPDIAREFLSRALESQRKVAPDDVEEEANLVLQLGRLTFDLGRLEEAERILRSFLDRTHGNPRLSPLARATIELSLAGVVHGRGDSPAMQAIAERLLSAPELEGESIIRLGAHRLLGVSLYYQGRYAEALAHQTEALRLAREAGNEELIGLALMWHSGVLMMMGQNEQALVEARQVAAMYDRLGSPGKSAQGFLFLGNLLADNKANPLHRQEALAVLEKTVRLGEQAQDPRRVGWALYHTSEVLREMGRLKEADERAQKAYQSLVGIGDKVGQASALKLRGQVALAMKAFDASEANLREAQELLRGLNHKLEEIDVLLRLGQLAAARGDREGAWTRVAELERMDLGSARPDLAAEFELLKRSVDPKASAAA